MKESDLEANDVRLAALLGWRSFKLTEGNGCADRIYEKGGYCFFVERKRPGGKLQPNQKQAIIESRRYGSPHYVVDDADNEMFKGILLKEEQRYRRCEYGDKEKIQIE